MKQETILLFILIVITIFNICNSIYGSYKRNETTEKIGVKPAATTERKTIIVGVFSKSFDKNVLRRSLDSIKNALYPIQKYSFASNAIVFQPRNDEEYFLKDEFPTFHFTNLNSISQEFWNKNSYIQFLSLFSNNICANKDDLIMLMEDDVYLCESADYQLQHVIGEAKRLLSDQWSFIRLSFGLNGIILKCGDVPAIIKALSKSKEVSTGKFHQNGVNDWLVAALSKFLTQSNEEGKKYFGQSRTHLVYKYNLMEKMVESSSEKFPGCMDILFSTSSGLESPDGFDFSCINYEFSPCKSPLIRQPILEGILDAHRLNPPANLKSPNQRIKILVGDFGQSCVEVCSNIGGKCELSFIPLLNECDTLKIFQRCHYCHDLRFFVTDYYRNPEYQLMDVL